MMIAFAIRLFVTQKPITEKLVCGIEDNRTQKHLKLFGTSVALALGNPPTISIFIAGSSKLNIFPRSMAESLVGTYVYCLDCFSVMVWRSGVRYFYIRARSTLNFIQYLNVTSIIFLLLFSVWSLTTLF